MNYYLYDTGIDMRKGIYSLYQIVKSEMKRNPVSAEVFIFLGKNRRSIKILHWDQDGFVLYYKKLEQGSYEMPEFTHSNDHYYISWQTFVLMMEGVGMRTAKFRKRFHLGV